MDMVIRRGAGLYALVGSSAGVSGANGMGSGSGSFVGSTGFLAFFLGFAGAFGFAALDSGFSCAARSLSQRIFAMCCISMFIWM